MIDKKYVTLTDTNFREEVLENKQPVLVDFWTDWCGPCHIIAPIIDELAADFTGKAKIAKLNVDQNANVANDYGISSIPTLLFYKNGQVVDHVVGLAPKSEIANKLHQLILNDQQIMRVES